MSGVKDDDGVKDDVIAKHSSVQQSNRVLLCYEGSMSVVQWMVVVNEVKKVQCEEIGSEQWQSASEVKWNTAQFIWEC